MKVAPLLGLNFRLVNNKRPMSKHWELDDRAFNHLLNWLAPEPEQAGRKYEEIRRKLIKIFEARGCPVAEELADETIDRVSKKAAELAADYVGDPALYFFGTAHKVFLEWRRRTASAPSLPPPTPRSAEDKEREDQCLEQCLAALPPHERHLLLEYYREDKRAKIDRRKLLASELGLTDNALKIKVFRLRGALQACLLHCLGQPPA